jgi:hypothetical protein
MSDNVRQRYRDFVALNLEPHQILFESQERSLIGDGIAKFELDGEQARGIVAVVSSPGCQILERDVSRNMMNIMQEIAGKKAAVSKAKFEQGVAILQGLTKGQVNEARARAWLKQLIEGSNLKVRGSGLLRRKRWFRKIKPVA